MKKALAVFLAAAVAMSLIACSSKDKQQSSSAGNEESGIFGNQEVELKQNKTLKEMAKQISNELEINMPGELDETTFEEVVGIKLSEVQQFGGVISMTMESADNFIAIEGTKDTVDKAKAALENRLHSVRKSFENYLPEEYAKAKDGMVITKGNFAFLIIVGRKNKNPAEEVKRAEEIVNTYFK